jgi:hypothetical protein
MVYRGMRKRPAQLVDPRQAHNAVTMQLLGVPTGKDRTLADQRARRADPGSDRPKVVTGNIDDGTVFNDLLNVLQQRNIIVNKAERGGQFGVEHRNAMVVNADSPIFLFYTQSSSDTAPTTNTVTFVQAAGNAIILGIGKWAVIAMGLVDLSHSTGGTVAALTQIEANDGSTRTYSSAATPGVTVKSHISLVDEADWLDGEQTLNVRVMFRSDTAGTTTAKNPAILVAAKRMD